METKRKWKPRNIASDMLNITDTQYANAKLTERITCAGLCAFLFPRKSKMCLPRGEGHKCAAQSDVEDKKQEIFLVEVPDAVVDLRTVMIQLENTPVARRAVVRPVGFKHVTAAAGAQLARALKFKGEACGVVAMRARPVVKELLR